MNKDVNNQQEQDDSDVQLIGAKPSLKKQKLIENKQKRKRQLKELNENDLSLSDAENLISKWQLELKDMVSQSRLLLRKLKIRI